jgi:hypothetical protein
LVSGALLSDRGRINIETECFSEKFGFGPMFLLSHLLGFLEKLGGNGDGNKFSGAHDKTSSM